MIDNTEKKNIKPVVKTPGKVKKKSETKKFFDSFISEDASNIGSYIVKEVLIPSLKRMLANAGKSAIDMFFSQGEERPESRISYEKYYRDDYEYDRRIRERERRTNYQRRSILDYGDIELSTVGEAQLVLDEAKACLRRYQVITIPQVLELANMPTDNYTLHNYGWTNLDGARIKRLSNGKGLLILPKALPID